MCRHGTSKVIGRFGLFLGTYFDQVVYRPGVGWQIQTMELRRVTGENRPSGEAIATVPL